MSTPPKPFEQRWAELKTAFRVERRQSRYWAGEHAKSVAEAKVLKMQLERQMQLVLVTCEENTTRRWINHLERQHAAQLAEIGLLKQQVEELLKHIENKEEKELGSGTVIERSSYCTTAHGPVGYVPSSSSGYEDPPEVVDA
jgi:uncharacterized protein with von Willebrand factor type A (vWA) domain